MVVAAGSEGLGGAVMGIDEHLTGLIAAGASILLLIMAFLAVLLVSRHRRLAEARRLEREYFKAVFGTEDSGL